MKTIYALAISVLLAGCSTAVVKSSFPDVPDKLMTPPAALKTLKPVNQSAAIKLDDSAPSDIQLSTLSKIISENYKNCNVTREQVINLQEWILKQKALNP